MKAILLTNYFSQKIAKSIRYSFPISTVVGPGEEIFVVRHYEIETIGLDGGWLHMMVVLTHEMFLDEMKLSEPRYCGEAVVRLDDEYSMQDVLDMALVQTDFRDRDDDVIYDGVSGDDRLVRAEKRLKL